jgi:hypothetical protein
MRTTARQKLTDQRELGPRVRLALTAENSEYIRAENRAAAIAHRVAVAQSKTHALWSQGERP